MASIRTPAPKATCFNLKRSKAIINEPHSAPDERLRRLLSDSDASYEAELSRQIIEQQKMDTESEMSEDDKQVANNRPSIPTQ